MSNLGSIGSEQIEIERNAAAQAAQLGAGLESAQTQHEQSLENARNCMSNRDVVIRTNGLKMILAMMSKGHDVSEFAPLVVQEVASPDPVGRQLAYVYLNHYADDALDSIVLAVNTFQRSLTDSDPLMRALAIKVMSSIRSRETVPAVRDAIIQVSGDASPYVRKAAAFAIIKAAGLAEDETETEEYLPSLERFINDENPITFSGAIAAYMALCPDNIELLHPRFRWICQNITKLDPWAQVFTLRALTIYARYCFKNPANTDVDDASNVAFWDESAQKDNISADLLLMISAAKKLFMSINPAVVLAAVSLVFYSAPPSQIMSVARPLIRLFYDSQLTAQIALTTALTIANVYPHVFASQINHFFVRRSDLTAVKKLKLRILTVLSTPENSDQILSELSMYSGSSDIEFATAAVKTMGKVAMSHETIIPSCLIKLLKLMNHSEGAVLAEVVLVIAHILRKNRKTDDESHALRLLCRKFITVKDPAARSAVLSIVGDMHPTHPDFAPVLLKHIAKNFNEEPPEVRLQSLTLAAKIQSIGTESKVPMYILNLGIRDEEFDVRDRARFLEALLTSTKDEISKKVQTLLFPERKAPTWTNADSRFMNFQVGTLSHLFEREVDGYEGLPDWAPESELPDESVRYAKGLNLSTTYYNEDTDEDDEDNLQERAEAGDLNAFFGDEEKEYYTEGDEEEQEVEEEVEEAEEGDENNDDFFADDE